MASEWMVVQTITAIRTSFTKQIITRTVLEYCILVRADMLDRTTFVIITGVSALSGEPRLHLIGLLHKGTIGLQTVSVD